MYEIQKSIAWENLLVSTESKIIIKCDASDYQRSKFGEKFIFRFQSMVDGRQSQIIAIKDRLALGIIPRYSQTGGPYPYMLPFVATNMDLFRKHYNEIEQQLWIKLCTENRIYHDSIRSQYPSFRSVYDQYLKSKEWSDIREPVLRKYNYQCAICYGTSILQVHHLTYKNIGHENMEDLICLCKSCHEKTHNL